MIKRLMILSAVLIASAGGLPARSPEPRIAPTPARPSGQIDWLSSARIFIIDGYTYPLTPKLEFDAVKLAETMADMHANVVRIATSGYCDWLIPGTAFAASPNLGNRDILAETIAACRPRGIKVVPYLRTGGPIRLAIMNPEWAQKTDPAGTINSYADYGITASALCWNTPYRQAFYDYVRIVAGRYDIDGIYFDSWLPFYAFTGQVCYCDGCAAGFRKASGKDLPYRLKAKDYTADELATIDAYRTWYREQLAEVFAETKRIVKSLKDIPLIYNINNPTRITNEDPRILNGSDAFLYERGRSLVERAEGVSLASAHGLAVWPYAGTYDPFPRIAHFHHELVQEIFTSVAFGGSPILYHTYFFTGHPEARGPVRDAFAVFERNEADLGGSRSSEFCAVVWNDADPPGHDVNAFLWDTNARLNSLGAFTACLNSHVQATSLLVQDLDDPGILNRYKVLYLSDICHLSDRQAANISDFVDRGGGLILTYATSLYDEGGARRPDFALGGLARIRYRKPDERLSESVDRHRTYGGVWDLYLKARPPQDVIRPGLSARLLPTHIYETVDVLPGGAVAADLVSGADQRPIVPGVVVSRHGQGKVAYLAAASEALYYQTGIEELADVIKGVIAYVSPDGLPYEVEAPRSALITNLVVGGKAAVLHLVNRTGSRDERILQNLYHLPPVNDVTVTYRLPKGKTLKGVRLFVPAEYSVTTAGNAVHVHLARVDSYQGVAIEVE